MRSHDKGSLSATTQVKVLSPEIFHFAQGQGFHILETNIDAHVSGECVIGVPGSKSVAGRRIDCIGTWENRSTPSGSIQEAEKAMRMYGALVVGLIHSRGVNRVMPVESQRSGILEGISSLKREIRSVHAAH